MTEDSGDYKVLTTNAIPQLTEVRFYEETWIGHIIERHTEFVVDPRGRESIESAVQNPTFVFESTTDPRGSVIFMSDSILIAGNPVLVPVKIITDTTSGRVKTAIATDDLPVTVIWSATSAKR
jgi:hypothetical protein